MRASRLTTRLLVGAGAVAGVVLGFASSAAADHQASNPPPKRPVITSAPASPGTDSTPTWAWTDPEGQANTCELRLGGATVFGPAACTSPITYNLSGQPYGTYTFLVENADAWASSTYTRFPAAPVITAAPTSPDNDASPTWSFTLPAGTAGSCSVLQGATVVEGPTACAGSYTASLTADGAYTFRVVAVGDGLTSAPDTSTYTFDSTLPPAPTITGSPSSPSADDTPTWTFTTSGDTASTLCSLSGVAALAPCTSPATYNVSDQPSGTYTFSVIAVDLAGNQSAPATSSYVRLAPPVITSSPTSPGNDPTPTWAYTVSGGDGTECTLSLGAAVVDGPVACGTSYTPTLAADGTYTFEVVAVDLASGVRSAPATRTYTFDGTAPLSPTITGGPTTPSAADSVEWTFTTTADTVSTLCSVSGGVAALAPCTSPASFDVSGQPSGTLTFSVIAVDAVGNQSAPATSSYVRLAPPVITSEPASPSNDATPTWSFSVPGGAAAECTLKLGAAVVDGPVACGTSYTPTVTVDGAYTFEVVSVDVGSGVRSAPATSTYTFDSTAPAPPTVTGFPASPTPDDTPTFTFTPSGDTVSTTCAITGQAAVPCASPHTFDLTGQPAGTYTATFTAVDAAGNASSTNFAFQRIVPPPPPTITGAPASPGNDTTPTWTFDLPPGTVGSCSLLFGAAVVAGPVDCVGAHTFTAASGDGAYTFRVVAVDVVTGLVSTPVTSTYTLDTTGPPAPTITGGPPSPVYEDFPTWTFTLTPDAVSAVCSVVSGAAVVVPEGPCTSPATFDLSAQPDGAYTFVVRGVDPLGNVGAAASSTYTLDRTPPTPTITGSPATPDNDSTPTWSFTTPAGTVTECTLLLGSTVVDGPTACTGSATYTVATGGTYTFQVVAVYPAIGRRGAAATSTYTFDGTPPAAPAFTLVPPSPGNDLTPRWEFTTPADAAQMECTLLFGTEVVRSGFCVGSFHPNIDNRPEGTYTAMVVAIDAVGNRSDPAVSTYVLDRTAPAPAVLTGGPTGLTNTALAVWTFTTPADATGFCSLARDGTIVSASAPCSGSASYDMTGLADGAYTFTVVARDAAGNSSAPVTANITLDRTPPETPRIQSGPSGTSTDDTPSWRFNAPGAAATRCSILQDGVVIIGPLPCGSPAAFDLTDRPDAVYTLVVESLDQAGNVSAPATSSYSLRTGRVAPTPAPAPPTPPAPAPAPLPPVDPGSVVIRDPGIDDSRIPRPAPAPGPVAPTPDGGPTTTTTIDPGPPAPPAGIITQAGRVVTEASRRAAFPLLLLGLVFLFLVIQNRIDRRDPKLAEAPVHAGDELEFGPPPSRRGRQ